MRSNYIKKSTLQMRLIKSLEALINNSREFENYQQRLQKIIVELNNTSISQQDYIKVLAFSFLLIQEIPEILKHPRNHSLLELTNDCRLQHEQTLRMQYRIGSNLR